MEKMKLLQITVWIESEDLNCWHFWILKKQKNAAFDQNYLKNEMVNWNEQRQVYFSS